MTVYFYSVRGAEFGCFSNFLPHGFELDGRDWLILRALFSGPEIRGHQARGGSTARTYAQAGREHGTRTMPAPAIPWSRSRTT